MDASWDGGVSRTIFGSLNNRVRSISLILFEVGISNLVCRCILRLGSGAYRNWVTVTLTSDIVSRNCINSGAYSYIL